MTTNTTYASLPRLTVQGTESRLHSLQYATDNSVSQRTKDVLLSWLPQQPHSIYVRDGVLYCEWNRKGKKTTRTSVENGNARNPHMMDVWCVHWISMKGCSGNNDSIQHDKHLQHVCRIPDGNKKGSCVHMSFAYICTKWSRAFLFPLLNPWDKLCPCRVWKCRRAWCQSKPSASGLPFKMCHAAVWM